MSVFSFFVLGTLWALPTELYPAKIRGLGEWMNIAIARGVGIIGVYGGSIIFSNFGSTGTFLAYGGFSAMAAIFLILVIGSKIKVHGRKLEEVDDQFFT